MKKSIILFLCIIFSISIVFALVGCKNDTPKEKSSTSQDDSITEQEEYIYLTSLTPIEKNRGYCEPTYNKACLGVDRFLLSGFPVNQGISMHPGADEDASLTYDISKFNYDLFVATIGKNDQQKNCNVKFCVYVDGVQAFDSGLMKEADMQFVSVNVRGAKKLKLVVNNGGDGHSYDECSWGYPTLINKSNFKAVNSELENIDYCILQGDNPLNADVSAIITYNTGTFRRVGFNELNFGNIDCNKLGTQKLSYTYNNYSFSKEICFYKKNTFIKLAQATFNEFISYFPQGSAGVDSDDGTAFAISGKLYNNGIGIHPVSAEKSGYITLSLKNDVEYQFHACVGKTRKAIRGEVIFKIYKDSEEIYNSGFVLAGQEKIVDLTIKNASELKIEVDSGDDDIDYDCAGIADAFLYSLNGENVTMKEDFLSLTKLTPAEIKNGYCATTFNQACLSAEGDRFMLSGFPITQGISMHASDENAYAVYDLSKYDYELFMVTIGKNNQQKDCLVEFYVYVDGVLKYDSEKIKEDDLRLVTVDISGAKSLKLEISNGGDGFSYDEVTWAYPTIAYADVIIPTDIKVENVDYIIEKGTSIDNDSVTAVVTYNTGCFERICKEELEFNGFDSDKIGKQEVEVRYKNTSFKFNVNVLEKTDFIKLCDVVPDEFVSYFPKRVAGVDCDDETNFAISGIRYKNGIGLHPVSNENPGKISFALAEDSVYKLHAVLGKTRKVVKGVLIFKILGDTTEIYNSGEILAGDRVTVDLDVTGYKKLTFVVEGGSDGIAFDCAGIADAFLCDKNINL